MNLPLIIRCKATSQTSSCGFALWYPRVAAKISLCHYYLALFEFLLLLISLDTTFAQDIPIERAQREYQARYHLINGPGQYVPWPNCDCGPAPNYPKDGFYGDLSKNPQKAKELVIDLRDAFFQTYKVYNYFVIEGFMALEGQTSFTYYIQDDFTCYQELYNAQDPIDEHNYAEKFEKLYNHCIKFLQCLPIHAHQTDPSLTPLFNVTDYAIGRRGYGQTNSNPADARAIASDDYESSGTYPTGAEFCQRDYTDWTDDVEADLLRRGGIIYADLAKQAELITTEEGLKLIDLSPLKGSGKAFLRVGKFDAYPNVATHDPFNDPNKVDNNYHALSGNPVVGTIYKSSEIGMAKPDFWPTPPSQGNMTGSSWRVHEALVLVKPDFNHDPDNCECGDCPCEVGTTTLRTHSYYVNAHLGQATNGQSAGFLLIHEPLPDSALFSPVTISAKTAAGVTNLTNQTYGFIQQVLAPQALVNIVTNSADEYSIDFHPWSANYVGGQYNSPLDPYFKSIIVKKNGSNTNIQLTEITRTSSSATTNITDFNYAADALQWEMKRGNGQLIQTKKSSWDANETNRTDTLTITNSANNLVQQRVENYWMMPWGLELVQAVEGASEAPLTNKWTYYTDEVGDGKKSP